MLQLACGKVKGRVRPSLLALRPRLSARRWTAACRVSAARTSALRISILLHPSPDPAPPVLHARGAAPSAVVALRPAAPRQGLESSAARSRHRGSRVPASAAAGAAASGQSKAGMASDASTPVADSLLPCLQAARARPAAAGTLAAKHAPCRIAAQAAKVCRSCASRANPAALVRVSRAPL